MSDLVKEALERMRMLALGNDYVNEHELRRDYDLVDSALDALERVKEEAEVRAACLKAVASVGKSPATPWPGAAPNKRNDDDCTCISAPGALCPTCHAGYGR